MSGQLTPKRSLDSLKKEAKRWLKALHANVDEARARLARAIPGAPKVPSLRDVQHALALEHGFDGWAALKNHLVSAPRAGESLAPYEEMADALLEAYRTGTPAAMERHWSLTWHRRTWPVMRTYVQLDLGKRPTPDDPDVEIALDDARFLIARERGFESWHALTAFVSSLPAGETMMAATPVRVYRTNGHVDGDGNGERDERDAGRDWNVAIGFMAEQKIGGLNAAGQMTDAIMEQVSRLEHITELKLEGSKQLTDAGLQYLARLPRLRYLDVGGCAITDRGLHVLRELEELEVVSLAWTGVTDAGVANLSSCERLERVDLSGTYAGDGAIKALRGKRTLHHFKSGNAVTDAGIPLLHEFPVFKNWQGGEASMALVSYDAGPNQVMLRGPFTDRGLASLAGLDGLFGLNVDARELAITAAGLAPLVTLPRLGWFAFDATDEAMPYIAAMPRLRFLGCQDTVAGDDGFVALSRSQSIESIWGRRCYNLQGRGFTALAAMPALRKLSVSCKNVPDEALAALPLFPALTEIMPMDVPDEGFRHVGRCDRLESLVLMYCRETSDAATEHMTRLPRLKKYFASYTKITDRTMELLAGMPSLERIEFYGCPGVTNDGVAALARLPRLRELRFSGQHITRDAVAGFPPRIRVIYNPP